MSFMDDDRPKKPVSHEIGCELEALSADELDRRIALLRQEIVRLEEVKQKKAAGRRAADSFFRS